MLKFQIMKSSFGVFSLIFFLSFSLEGCYLSKLSTNSFENQSSNSNSDRILSRKVPLASSVPFEVTSKSIKYPNGVSGAYARDITKHASVTKIKLGSLGKYIRLINSKTGKEVKKDDISSITANSGIARHYGEGLIKGTLSITLDNFFAEAKDKLENTEKKSKTASKKTGDVEFTINTEGVQQSTINAILNADLVANNLVKEIKILKNGNIRVTLGPLKLLFNSSITKNRETSKKE